MAEFPGTQIQTLLSSVGQVQLYDLKQHPRKWHSLYDNEKYGSVRREVFGVLLKHID